MVVRVEDELVGLGSKCHLMGHYRPGVERLTISSTVAVYSRIPAEMESRIPAAIDAEAEVMDWSDCQYRSPGTRVVREVRRLGKDEDAKTHCALPRPESDGHTQRCHARVRECPSDRSPVPRRGQLQERKAGPEAESLEHLVEDDDDEEGRELVWRGEGEGEADDDLAVVSACV